MTSKSHTRFIWSSTNYNSMNNRSRAESESVLSAGEYRRRYSPFTFTPRISSQGCALANWQCHRKYLRYHLWLWFWLAVSTVSSFLVSANNHREIVSLFYEGSTAIHDTSNVKKKGLNWQSLSVLVYNCE